MSDARNVESMDSLDVILAGEFVEQAISSKGDMALLQKLRFVSCNYPEYAWSILFSCLSICKKLTHLIVSRNSLYEAGAELANSIKCWGTDSPLQVLQLDQCQMPEDTWCDLVRSLFTCKQIT